MIYKLTELRTVLCACNITAFQYFHTLYYCETGRVEFAASERKYNNGKPLQCTLGQWRSTMWLFRLPILIIETQTFPISGVVLTPTVLNSWASRPYV